MPASRIIKKYPNRRLYDTDLSRYVTLADVRELVMQRVDVIVIDTNTQEDLTRSILLQIMLDEESGGQPLFSSSMLAQIIRFYGGTMQGLLARYLEETLGLFTKQQDKLIDLWGENPVDPMRRMARHNLKLWTELQDKFIKAAGLDSDITEDTRKKKSETGG